MNANVLSALFRDAFLQVVDNKVFRVLLVLLLVLVIPTFLIGAREEELVVLFFWKYRYEDVFGLIGNMSLAGIDHPNQALIQGLQRVFIDGLAGGIGILFGIVATAFFVPRMLEKGAADVVFSKPVSRFALLMTRYVAGLIFATILAVLMIGGMHIGLLLNSGWSDPGFLWSIPILVYVFGVVHAVSVLVGTLTKSSVAAILVTMIFYGFNGCVHKGWMLKEVSVIQATKALEAEGAGPSEEARGFWRVMGLSLDGLHYALPKTTDADRIAASVRKSFEMRAYELYESESQLAVAAAPSGFTRTAASDLASEGVGWTAPHPGGRAEARIALSRRKLGEDEDRSSNAKALKQELADLGISTQATNRERLGEHSASLVEWQEGAGNATRLRRVYFFDDEIWLGRLEYDADLAWAEEDAHANAFEAFRHGVEFAGEVTVDAPGFQYSSGGPIGSAMSRWQSQFGWTAPLPYNYCFSIGSTLAFIALVLGLAQWRLSRMDF